MLFHDNPKEKLVWLEDELLERYGLVQKRVADFAEPCRDVLVYKKDYHFSALDKLFLKELDYAR